MKILYSNEQIYDLIPQRPPMVMIDTLLESDEQAICTAFTIRQDNIFFNGTHFEETGLIEHIAQTAAALAGYETISQNLAPKLGYIGEIKNFECHICPKLGDTIQTRMEIIAKMEGVTLAKAITSRNEQSIATCQMKIFIQED